MFLLFAPRRLALQLVVLKHQVLFFRKNKGSVVKRALMLQLSIVAFSISFNLPAKLHAIFFVITKILIYRLGRLQFFNFYNKFFCGFKRRNVMLWNMNRCILLDIAANFGSPFLCNKASK